MVIQLQEVTIHSTYYILTVMLIRASALEKAGFG